MSWKIGPALAICLALACPRAVVAGEVRSTPSPAEGAGAGGSGEPRAHPATPSRLAILEALPDGTLRRGLLLSAGGTEEEAQPPEPPREPPGRTKVAWYRTRTAVILMVVAGAVVVGSTALNSLREET